MESLAQQTQPQPKTCQTGARGCACPAHTSASWTPAGAISRQGCRESCQCEQHQLRKRVR